MRGVGLFMCKQPGLAFDAAGTAGACAGSADRPVTRDNNGDRIGGIGVANGAAGPSAVEQRSQRAIGFTIAGCDTAKRIPGCVLYIGAAGPPFHLAHSRQPACKICIQPICEHGRNRGGLGNPDTVAQTRQLVQMYRFLIKIQPEQHIVREHDNRRADRVGVVPSVDLQTFSTPCWRRNPRSASKGSPKIAACSPSMLSNRFAPRPSSR